jgi:hypothetical protein
VAIARGGGGFFDELVPSIWPETKDRSPQAAATLFVFALPEKSK